MILGIFIFDNHLRCLFRYTVGRTFRNCSHRHNKNQSELLGLLCTRTTLKLRA